MGFGLKKSSADHSYFYKTANGLYLGVLIYVDDILLACNTPSVIRDFKSYLGQHFSFKDLGYPRYFLGLEIATGSAGISVCQRKYALDLLHDAGLTGCKPSAILMDANVQLTQDGSKPLSDPKVLGMR